MARLFIKGNQKGIRVSTASAQKVGSILANAMIPDSDWIVVPEFTGEKGSIRGVQMVEDEEKDDQQKESEYRQKVTQDNEDMGEELKKYRDDIEKKCLESIDIKSKNTNIATTIFVGITGHYPSPDFHREIAVKQRAYFVEHPKHPYANPSCYRALLPVRDKVRSYDTLLPLQPLVTHGAMRFAERIVGKALQTAKELGYIAKC